MPGHVRPCAPSVVLVEGVSDQVALEVLAARLGRDLDAEGVRVVAMGGATSIGRFLELFGPPGCGARLSGLCDAGEERSFRRSLERIGVGPVGDRCELERLGFFVCVADLEDELIRALGVEVVEQVVDAQGDRPSLCRFRDQPAQRDRDAQQQLRRFMGTRSGRKAHYARALVEALDLDRVPRPLAGVLAAARH